MVDAKQDGLTQGLKVMLGVVAVLWLIQVVNFVLLQSLNVLGIHAWDLFGLVGILFAPLLHTGFGHLIANTLPLLVLGTILWSTGRRDFGYATAAAWIGSGLAAWALSFPGTVIVGASGVIFGWITFLIVRGFATRQTVHLLVAVGVAIIYGTVLLGVFPTSSGVSWQGHLGGAVGGLIAALKLYGPKASRR